MIKLRTRQPIKVNGTKVDGDITLNYEEGKLHLHQNGKPLKVFEGYNIIITGDVDSITMVAAEDFHIHGNVGSVETATGDVICHGNATNISTVSGTVSCDRATNINTKSGSILQVGDID